MHWCRIRYVSDTKTCLIRGLYVLHRSVDHGWHFSTSNIMASYSIIIIMTKDGGFQLYNNIKIWKQTQQSVNSVLNKQTNNNLYNHLCHVLLFFSCYQLLYHHHHHSFSCFVALHKVHSGFLHTYICDFEFFLYFMGNPTETTATSGELGCLQFLWSYSNLKL
jgi:hypothetical protein